MTSLGQRIRSQRKELGLSLSDIRERTGIEPASLSRLENGKTKYLAFESMCLLFNELDYFPADIDDVILDVVQASEYYDK